MALDIEVKAIRKAPVFHGTDACQLRLLACLSERVAFEGGEFIYHQGDISDAVYIVIDGEVELVLEGPTGITTVAREGDGAVFGEVGLLCDARRCAGARAASEYVTLLQIRKDSFFRLMQDNAKFSLSIARALAQRVTTIACNADRKMAQ